jgi:asparagine synthase (glutamine-hydrolysing)
MCGIAGVLALDGRTADRRALDRAMACLTHRGPNGEGMLLDGPVALGHRRLSILDPSDAGAQPMTREGISLVHNGEVYNFLEIAAELAELGVHLSTATDTEVVIEAYRAWGLDAFERFNGMWAMALWDAPRARLVLSRDRIGVKPLYVRRSSRSLAFASEPPALVAAAPLDDGDTWRPEPFLPVVRDFLARGLVDHVDAGFVAGIEAVAPGTHLVIDGTDVRVRRYWSTPPLSDDDSPRGQPGDARLVERFAELLADATRLRLRSDVPLGSCLSGGLDSSAIVQLVADHLAVGVGAREQVPRYAFHARYPGEGVDESAYAELVARRAGVELVIADPPGTLLTTLTDVLRVQGAPFASSSIIAQHQVMRAAAARDVTVLLDGQGADELLGGYPRYLGYRAAGLLWRRPGAALHELRATVAIGSADATTTAVGLARALAGDRPREALRAASGGRFGMRLGTGLGSVPSPLVVHDEPGTLLARRLWQDLRHEGLPALLRYEDRNSMAFGIEARVPFLDYRLVELACGLPDRLRVSRGRTKVVLRRAMRGRLPAAILDRRDKMGFVSPQAAWTGRASAEIAPLLRGGRVVDRGWVVDAEVERLLAASRTPGAANDQLWRLLVTELWLRDLEGGGTVDADVRTEQAESLTRVGRAQPRAPGRSRGAA